MNNITYIGMDVHKDMIDVAAARPGRESVQVIKQIRNSEKAVKKLVKELERCGESYHFCYEAGPCGYELYRYLQKLGHSVSVIAPSLIPKKSGDKIKTNSRDAIKLASLSRAGELTEVWVPDAKQEACW